MGFCKRYREDNGGLIVGDKAKVGGFGNGLGAPLDLEFLVNVVDVLFYRPRGDN